MAKKKPAQTEEKSVVEVAKERYERARDFYSIPRTLALADTQFVMGDSDNGWQWPAEIYRDRATVNKKPCLTVNVTAQHCNQIINNIRQNRPSAKVNPVDDFADKDTAMILGGMLRSIQTVSNADTAHDLGAEHALYGGEGYWRVITEYDGEKSFDQVIRIKSIPNPFLVYIDPDAKEPDRSDAKWGFVFEDISKEQAKEEHPDIDPTSWAEDSIRGWVNENTVRRAEYFWCVYEPDALYLLSDGTSVLKSELTKDGATVEGELVMVEGVPVPDLTIIHERETKIKKWKWCKLLGGEDKPVDERDWPGSYMPIITVVGKELNVDGLIVRKGVVRDLKDPARMVNYSYSAAVETLALQNKIPYMASAEAIEGFEAIYAGANVENRAYLPWNELGENGAKLTKPERQQSAVMPTAQVQMLQLSTEQMRAASGQQNSNFGIKSEASSGVGIQRLKAQGEIATFHFPDNLARALKYEAMVVLDLIPKVSERKQIVRILGLDGKEDAAVLDPEMEGAYSDVNAKVDKIFNPSVGKYDVAIDTGPSYQTQRQESADGMRELVQSFPQIMEVAGDQIVRGLDLINGDKIADRLEKALPPGLADDAGDETAKLTQENAQLKQGMDQAKMLVGKMNEHIQELEKQANTEKTKLITAGMKQETDQEAQEDQHNINTYKAETERLKALADKISPEALQPLIRQTILEILASPPLPEEREALRNPVAEPEPLEAPTSEMTATGAQPGLA